VRKDDYRAEAELEGVQAKYTTRKTTQQEIAYLTDLLKCANKKLGWEKQLASLQKRTPAVLDQLTTLMNDPANPPTKKCARRCCGLSRP